MKSLSITLLLSVFLISPAFSTLIPYDITGTYYDHVNDITHSVSGSTLIDNSFACNIDGYDPSTGEGIGYSHYPTGGSYEEVRDFFDLYEVGGTNNAAYFLYSFSLESNTDPSRQWNYDQRNFWFEFTESRVWLRQPSILYEMDTYLMFDFYDINQNIYDIYDPLVWFELAPEIHLYGRSTYESSWDLTFQKASTPVPEPSTFLLLGSGLTGLAWYRRRKKE